MMRSNLSKLRFVLPWIALLVGPLGIVNWQVESAMADTTAENSLATPRQIAELIEQLGADEGVLRDHAQRELKQIGAPALDILIASLDHEDLEIASRVAYLVKSIPVFWVKESDPEPLRAKLAGYEEMTAAGRFELIEELRIEAEDTEIAVLARIARYDKSPAVAKHAALFLIDLQREFPDSANQWRKSIQEEMGSSTRAGAKWLRSSFSHGDNLEAFVREWDSFIQDEQKGRRIRLDSLARRVVVRLMRMQIEWLKALGQHDAAMDLIAASVEWELEDPDSLAELVKWLVHQRAWQVVDQVASDHASLFKNNVILLYSLAEAQWQQGKRDIASKTADKANALLSGRPPEHFEYAYRLQNRGLFVWAEQQYREVLKREKGFTNLAIRTTYLLAEMLHDQQQEQQGALVLQALVKELDNEKIATRAAQFGRKPDELRSRMNYFFAEHHRLASEFDKAKEFLEKAIAEDDGDADVLIALYRLPNQTPEQILKIRGGITLSAARLRVDLAKAKKIGDSDERDRKTALYANQMAWLLGNTLAEKSDSLAKEAVRLSHKSLEIRPQTAGYLDTLGRCYFAQGDLKTAIQYQRQAVRLEPHTGQISRQLELFQQQLAQTKKPS